MDRLTQGEVMLAVLCVSHVSIIPPLLPADLQRDTTPIRRTSGRNLGAFKQSGSVPDIGEHWTEKYFDVAWNELRAHLVRRMPPTRGTKIGARLGTNL